MNANFVAVAPAEPISVVDYRAYCDAWVQHEDGLALVSLLGPHTVLQALWGHLTAGHIVELEDGTLLHRQSRASDTEEQSAEEGYMVRYHRAAVRFADIGQAHLVMVAEPATLQVGPGQCAYLLAAQPAGDPERFFMLWNRAMPLPARAAWAMYLWREGLRRGAVRPIPAYGCHAWAIEPQLDPWKDILRWGIEDGELI